MKKQLLIGAFALASFFTANAQEIVGTNFGTDQASYEAVFTVEGWGSYAFDEDGDFFFPDAGTEEAIALGFSGVSMWSASFINEGTQEDPNLVPVETGNFIASPAIDLAGVENAFITMKVGAFGAAGATMGYQVLVIDEQNWIDEEFTNTLFIAGEGTVAAGTSGDITVDLTSFVDFNVRIILIHDSATTDGLGYLILDDISVVNGVASTNDNTLAKLAVYPNPANDVVNVTVDAAISNVVVADLNGRTVKNAKFNGVSEASVNISDLSAGVYMMTVSSDKGSITKKIVKN